MGRMFSIDPRAPEYPWQTAYSYHRNSPISIIDYLGGGDNDDWIKKKGSNQWEWDADVTSEKEAIDKYGDGTEYGRIGKIYSSKDGLVELGANAQWSMVTANDQAEQMILDEDYRYTKNYGWVDFNHAFEGNGPQLLIEDVINESLLDPKNSNLRLVTYQQGQSNSLLTIGKRRSYNFSTGLTYNEQISIALFIFEDISMAFERLQGEGVVGWVSGDSSFEPADLTSNLLGFYRGLGYPRSVLEAAIQPVDVATSLEIYRMYPGTYGDEKYKNYNMFSPIYFDNPYTGTPVYPSNLFIYKPGSAE